MPSKASEESINYSYVNLDADPLYFVFSFMQRRQKAGFLSKMLNSNDERIEEVNNLSVN